MTIDVDVLVVGAGPAGLAAAIELGVRGISVLVVEKNSRGGTAPRAKTTNVRTRTHLRRWGIADRLAEEAPFGIDYPNNMIFVTRLSGHELARFPNAFNAAPDRSPLYPEHAQWIPQYKLEQVLLEKVRTLASVELRFGSEFAGAHQSPDVVLSTLREGGGDKAVSSKYLIGADGARSATRDLIGAKLEGRHGLSHSYNVIFRAPGLAAAHQHGPAAIYWQFGKDGVSTVGPMDRNDTWFFMPGGATPGEQLSKERAAELIVERTGIDLPFEILSADAWTASELLADKYRDGRIFLAGDACHLHPPYGGYGMNMGIGDGVDLGWKMAATLKGWGGDALLASYEAERRLVHRIVIDEAVANHSDTRIAPPAGLEDDSDAGAAVRAAVGAAIQATKEREFFTLGIVLGVGYEGSPIVEREDGDVPPLNGQVYTPSARPGQLAPHAWLDDGRSIYDVFGDGFTLILAADMDSAWETAATDQAISIGVPLAVVRPAGVDVRALYGAGLILVRPDQHVAWRGETWDGFLHRATGHLQPAKSHGLAGRVAQHV